MIVTSGAWIGVGVVVISAAAGDVTMAAAMRNTGPVQRIYRQRGLLATIWTVLKDPLFPIGVSAMAVSFFALLWTLNHAELSFVVPATNSLTFVANAIGAHFFLSEHVNRRRWFAVAVISAGVALLAR